MHECIKTGAVVHFLDYNCVARCDLHVVRAGGDILVKLGGPWDNSVEYLNDRVPFGVTHEVTCLHAYVRKDLGLVMVPPGAVKVVAS